VLAAPTLPSVQQRIWASALLAAAGWGTGTVVSRVAIQDGATPYQVALARGLIAGTAVALLLAVRRGFHRPGRSAVSVGVVMGVTNMAIPFVSGNIALQYASAGFVALPLALIPLATAALAHVFLPDERLTAIKAVGLSVALVGVAVLALSGDSGLEEGGRPVVAVLLGLLSVVSISAGSIYSKRHAGSYQVLEVSLIQFLIGSVLVVGASLAIEGTVGAGPRAAWPEFGYLGLISTLLPFGLWYWLIRRVTATYAAAIGYVVPLVAVVVGVIALGEKVQPGIAVGGVLILAGVILTDRLERMKSRLEYR
jgi:drug/metabolite transporter (DMT)-like permease